MRDYHPETYIELVENSQNPFLLNFMNDEMEFLGTQMDGWDNIIDLGAGYGRILPIIKNTNRHYFGIEINPNMFAELESRCNQVEHAIAINGDITELDLSLNLNDLLLSNNLFMLLQNTIGTIEGSVDGLLAHLKNLLHGSNSNLIISFFKKEALGTEGIKMFSNLEEMVGEPDLLRSNFAKGQFISKTGYEAKWWSKPEIDHILNFLEAKIIATRETENFIIYNLTSIL